MKRQNRDLFAADRRLEKLGQYTKVLDTLSVLVDWKALAEALNPATGRQAAQPKGGRPPSDPGAGQAHCPATVVRQPLG